MSKKAARQVIVTVDDQFLKNIDDVAKKLRSAGMKVGNVMSSLGIVAGEVSDAKLEALKKVKGVKNVELDEEMKAI